MPRATRIHSRLNLFFLRLNLLLLAYWNMEKRNVGRDAEGCYVCGIARMCRMNLFRFYWCKKGIVQRQARALNFHNPQVRGAWSHAPTFPRGRSGAIALSILAGLWHLWTARIISISNWKVWIQHRKSHRDFRCAWLGKCPLCNDLLMEIFAVHCTF